jgi:hypothetical protein
VAQKYGLYKYIRFNTSVEGATWEDSTNRWKVDVKVTGEKDAEFNPAYSIDCDFLVSAVGQLNQPRYPEIEGLQDFKGKIMHSARWDWSYDVQGKNVAVIGNGTSSTHPSYTISTNTTQAPQQPKSSPKSCPPPPPSQSTNALPTGSSRASTAPSRPSAAQYTATCPPCVGASAQT